MNIGICPPIAGIRFVGVEHAETVADKKPKALGWFAVVLMDFRWTVGKVKVAVVDGVGKRQLDELLVGKDFFISRRIALSRP